MNTTLRLENDNSGLELFWWSFNICYFVCKYRSPTHREGKKLWQTKNELQQLIIYCGTIV